MAWRKLHRSDLDVICGEFGIDCGKHLKKAEVIRAMEASRDDEEIVELWEDIKKKREDQERERHKEEQERVRERERKHELDKKRLDLEIARATTSGGATLNAPVSKAPKIKDLLNPFKMGEDIGLFLVNFERSCEGKFERELWAQMLLTVLPCEAADVLARLPRDEANDYDIVKRALLKRYRLSAEAFRRRFRNSSKRSSESFADFAYSLRCNLTEWLKGEGAFGDHDKVVELICTEQFLNVLSDEARLWVLDQPGEKNLERTAELAEEYTMRREEIRERNKPAKKPYRENSKQSERNSYAPIAPGGTNEKDTHGESTMSGRAGKEKEQDKNRDRAFEAKKPIVCYRCNEPGHLAVGCRKEKLVFSLFNHTDENMRLLEPYLREMTVNGQNCRVLRDSAATMDVIHPSYVPADGFTGDCAWIRQVAQEDSVCLPVAKVLIKGPFGELETEAAVSQSLPKQYGYLFSNHSEDLLRKKGLSFGEHTVHALTRSKAKEIAKELGSSQNREAQAPDETRADANQENVPSDGESSFKSSSEASEEVNLLSVLPCMGGFLELSKVSPEVIAAEQAEDKTLQKLSDMVEEGLARKNVFLHRRAGILYRQYKDSKGVHYDQLVVPQKYRAKVLELCHGGGWSGHLGKKKTKTRLLREFYWPNCFKDTERYVQSCDVCQRIGKAHDQQKAPLKLVPLISEPFRRLVVDVVGPLPVTKSGYRYILTLICPATKFPEAVPLKEQSSVEIVDALLSVFSRVGFPSELQSDQGSVFTSALTTTFLERCGIRIIHSSVRHPQSNSVEAWHSVLKRVLRALCYENRKDWEACLPATMFALRSVPHEATGFSPAELVYGRSLRTPLRMLRESWEGRGEDPTVIEYVLGLLGRLQTCRELVEANMTMAQLKAKRLYDKNARQRSFSEGDQVMLLASSKANKLAVQWEGPAKVMQKLSDTNYVVKLPGRRKEVKIYHSNLMKPYHQRSAVVQLALNVPEELETDFPFPGQASDSQSLDILLDTVTSNSNLNAEQKRELENLLREFEGAFVDRPGRTDLVEHDIELTSDEPILSRPYRVSPRQREILAREIQRMLEIGVIVPSESEYTSPLILVEAPGKEPRPCIDYRKLNAVTRDQLYPIPNVEERVETVSRAQYVSTLDLTRGYWQVPMTERASKYAAFISPLGTFRPLVMSFGLKNAPFCFSRLMDRVLAGAENYAVPYLDDIAVFSDSWEKHLSHLRDVLTRLRNAGLTVKAEKCQLGQAEVEYLGHIVGRGCRRPHEVKLAAIENYPRPVTKTDIRAFLGLTGYYQHYIPKYSQIASPLTDSLRKGEPVKVQWDELRESSFQALKAALTSQPILRAPDYNRPFVLQCDASERGLGAVLSQRDESREEHPVLFISRKLSTREEAYSTSEKECACLVWAIYKLRCYLAGSPFLVETDHCPLSWLRNMSPKNGRLLRWSLALQEHNFEIRYKKGRDNGNADALSRGFL